MAYRVDYQRLFAVRCRVYMPEHARLCVPYLPLQGIQFYG